MDDTELRTLALGIGATHVRRQSDDKVVAYGTRARVENGTLVLRDETSQIVATVPLGAVVELEVGSAASVVKVDDSIPATEEKTIRTRGA